MLQKYSPLSCPGGFSQSFEMEPPRNEYSFSLPDDKTNNMKQDPHHRNYKICVTGCQRVCTYDLSGIPWILFRVLPWAILSGDLHHFRQHWFIALPLFITSIAIVIIPIHTSLEEHVRHHHHPDQQRPRANPIPS